MEIFVCIGSACHKKGSYEIMKRLKSLILANGLEQKVTLKSAFCLGQCKNGINIKINEEIISGVTLENIDVIFKQYVLN